MSAAAKHTPGPWEIVQECTNSLDIIAEETCVCSINTEEDLLPDDCEERANARLIAAAPELLEALTYILMSVGRLGANADVNHPYRGAWEAARAAIAKTEE